MFLNLKHRTFTHLFTKKFNSNKEEWNGFKDYIQNATASVIECIARVDPSQTDLKVKLTMLQRYTRLIMTLLIGIYIFSKQQHYAEDNRVHRGKTSPTNVQAAVRGS